MKTCYGVDVETIPDADGRTFGAYFHICDLSELIEKLQDSYAGRNPHTIKITSYAGVTH